MTEFRTCLREAQRGGDDAFARLWRRYNPILVRYLTVRSGAAADDLAADVWLSAVRALRSFDGDEPQFKAWLLTIARNRLTDWYRGSARRPSVTDPAELDLRPGSDSVEGEAEDHSATDRALAVIGRLPPDQAEAVMLRFVAGLDVALVATIMQRSAGAVRVLSHRGLKSLKASLAAPGADTSPPAAWSSDGIAQVRPPASGGEVKLHA